MGDYLRPALTASYAAHVSDPAIADDVLAALRIPTLDRAGELAGACARIAQRLRANAIRIVGFLPAGDTVAIPPLLVHLGLALSEPTGARVAIVDANVRFPGLADAVSGLAAAPASAFATRWIRPTLALVAPPAVQPAGLVVPALSQLVAAGMGGFEHVLVDLTGFERLGEHIAATACVDAVAIVARKDETHEQRLLALAAVVPPHRMLGVTLVG